MSFRIFPGKPPVVPTEVFFGISSETDAGIPLDFFWYSGLNSDCFTRTPVGIYSEISVLIYQIIPPSVTPWILPEYI